MDIFLNRLIQFYSNNATKLHHSTARSSLRRVALQHRDRNMITDYCDVTSSYVCMVQFRIILYWCIGF